jgi:transcriptional regulator with AAA-type ATPase domain
MALLTESERRFLAAVSRLAYCNPFLPERTTHEQSALGRDYVTGGLVWSASAANPDATSANVNRVHARLGPLIEKVRTRLAANPDADPVDLAIYEDCAHHLIYQRSYPDFIAATTHYRFYERFAADWKYFFFADTARFESALDAAHFFACFRQVQRAFHHIFDNIIGNSMPAALLRASVWQSIFTHDLRRYRRVMYKRIGDFPTLITGPSGTGKELVARAIAGARYIPFDPKTCRFADPSAETFIPINLAALSATLIESELFGHRRGAFTGALGDRKGWLDSCPATGSVFLDELGELESSIQVKLLRVLETRRFSAVGDTATREFHGKLIAATNRNLPAEIRAGRFREDLYYRLCADQIATPSLQSQIEDSPEGFRDLVLFMVRRAVGEDAERSMPEVEDWLRTHLPPHYTWPGNYRELEQCVRNIIIRRSYRPMEEEAKQHNDPFMNSVMKGERTADELMAWYAALVYGKTGTYDETARRLDLDRRTAKAHIERYLNTTTARKLN